MGVWGVDGKSAVLGHEGASNKEIYKKRTVCSYIKGYGVNRSDNVFHGRTRLPRPAK
jgi:hypothetical protein